MRSQDLVHWERVGDKLFGGNRERWPSVLRVDDDSHLTTFYMAYTENYGRPSYIVLKKSTDARFEGSPRTKLVREEECCNNQNPALFQDPRTKSFYLYWFRQCAMKINPCEGHKNWEIWVKEASSVEGLADPNIRPKQLMERPWTIAAPQVMYHRGKYYLAVETRRKRPVAPGDGETWYTWVYSSSDPQGPFTLLPGNPLLGDGSGCFFQYIFDGTLHAYYCKQTPPVIDGPDQGLTWTIDHRTSDPGAGGALVPKEDGENWPGFSSDVREQLVPSVLNRDGSEDVVLQVEMTDEPYQIFESSFSGEDYVVEVNGRQVGGGAWGLGVRVSDSSLYSVSVSNGVDAGSKLSLNRWDDNEATFGLDASIGEVEVGEWVRLTAKVHSSEIEVDVNGQKKLETKDDKAIASGRVALYGERGTTAQFSNVFVRKYAAMEPTVSISPAH